MKDSINIGLIGMGIIGSGVAKILTERAETITKQVGIPLKLVRAADLDTSKKILLPDPDIFTTNAQEILAGPDIDIVIELIGGENPAKSFIEQALKNGKHVITANKEVLAKHGPELMTLADNHNVSLLYEASVGGGIPLISPLRHYLQNNDISAIHGIINGTTNYILTRMEKEGLEFADALSEAQGLGYAEADPTSDIEGFDAAYKIAILAAIAFHMEVHPEEVYHEGISRMAPQDFRYARELGYAIKLLAMAKKEEDSAQVMVHPVFVPMDMLLAEVDGVYNAVQIEGDLSGKVIFYGRGAGSDPTANVIVADAIHIAGNIIHNVAEKSGLRLDGPQKIKPIEETETRYYIRMTIMDRPGVLAEITRIFGEHMISISSAIQKEADSKSGTAEIVIMTHASQEKAMRHAVDELKHLKRVKEVSNLIRVED